MAAMAAMAASTTMTTSVIVNGLFEPIGKLSRDSKLHSFSSTTSFYRSKTVMKSSVSLPWTSTTSSHSDMSSCTGSTVKAEEDEGSLVKVLSAKRLAVSLGATLAVLLTGIPQEVALAETFPSHGNEMCQLAASEVAVETAVPVNGMMMRGMTTNNFDPVRYAGRWYEVASLKKGFAGQGQGDCHCTQGIYTVDLVNKAIQVDTFCVHGKPDGYVTGIRGKVQCVPDSTLETVSTDLELQEMVKEKCFLRFPTLPFIPKEPYDVIDTDYDTFALVSGARDTSFIQIYSRTPNPGKPFIEKYKAVLANYGYDANQIVDTPQDCPDTSMGDLEKMMSPQGVRDAMTNTLPIITNENVRSNGGAPLSLGGSLRLPEMKGMLVDTFKKLFELYQS